ncbi:hypothetical protein [Luteolibacter sp. AS25]|uniref:hypothetical protein n=1 Tax=Luteolibacter sp. AS25 TaxID=3135776 RepID=UPI00398B1B90
MAWRLDQTVEHGLIDNTVEGITTGKIWLVGRDEPLILSLNGDCWRDLAGTILEFENPKPSADPEVLELDTDQTGIIGDITASRKARIPDLADDEIEDYEEQGKEIPFRWQHVLYIEWFGEINGRILIETVGFKLTISDASWEMDEDAEEAQKLANLSAMRDFLAQIIRRSEPDGKKLRNARGVRIEMNEFEWEERLKESDRLSDAYQEVLEKYMEDADSERKEAFVMGWDGLLGAMAEREEGGEEEDDFEEEDEDSSEEWRDDESGEEDDSEKEEYYKNPLQVKAHEIALRSCDLVGPENQKEGPEQRLVSNLIQVSTKLAAALHCQGTGFEPETGFVLAILKRCLNYINEAIGASGDLLDREEDQDQRAALEHLRADVFEVRDHILGLRQELKRT